MRKYFSKLLLMVMFIPWVMQAQTTPAPASLPYTCGFEDATENANWVIENGASATNKFFIGSAVNNGGTQSLYVSDANGVSNSYTSDATAAGYVYAYREFTITGTGIYRASFDWRAKGESTFDFLRVFLIPDNAADALTPSTGTSAHTGVTASASPASWIPIDNNVKLNLQDTWQSFVGEDLQLTPGTYKLVFYWRTDISGTYDPPVAVDNVTFTDVTCPRPTNLAVTSLSNTSVTLSWTSGSATAFAYVNDTANAPRLWNFDANTTNDNTVTINDLTPNTAYTFYLQSLCSGSDTSLWVSLNFRTACTPIASENLPYHESFESWASGAFDPCYVATNNNTTAVSYPSVNTSYHSDSAKSLYMYSTAAYASWLAMPMFETPINQLQVSFDLYKTAVTRYPFMVGVMSDPHDISTFDTITIVECDEASTWKHITVPLSIYQGSGMFIAFVSPNGIASNNYIDNIVVEELSACPDPINVTAYAINDQDVTIAWTETGATGYIAEYGLMGFTLGTGTQEMGVQDSINLYGLNPATAYDIYLRADCGEDTGNWIGPITVRTACPDVVNISEDPYIENFDSYNSVSNTTSYSADNNLPSCWDFYSNGSAGATVAYWPRIYRGTSYCPTSNDNALLMYVCNYAGTTASSLGYLAERGTEKMAVLPVVSEPLNNVTISFDARVYTVSTSVIDTIFVAIATSDSTYIPLTHFEGVSGLQEIEVNLANYSYIIDTLSIENPRVAIVFKASTYATTTSLRANYLGVDNVTVAKNNSCLHPYAGSIINVTDVTATFSFADSVDVGSYEIAWATANDVLLATSTNIVSDTTGIITELEPNTVYYAWVRAICGGDYSNWEELGEFRTLCSVVDSLPYSENFESYNTGTSGTMNPCWTKGTTSTTAYPYVTSTGGSNRLYFYSSSSYYSYAALPMFSAPLNTLQISFDLLRYKSTTVYASDIIVGVMGNPHDITTFVPVDTIVPNIPMNATESYEVSFESYVGEGCIAFVSPVSVTDYSYIDNVVVSEIPSCKKSTNLVAKNVTATTATLAWDNATGDSYVVAYSTNSDFSTATAVSTTTDSVVVSGLTPYKEYYFVVKAVCGADSGAWSNVALFTTAQDCGANYELVEPYMGDSTSTSNSSTYPFYLSTSYSQAGSWQLYTQEELEMQGVYSGNINSISYKYVSATPEDITFDIYVAEVSADLDILTTADTIAYDQMTLVYSGTKRFRSEDQWTTIMFDTPFVYSGTGNLMVAAIRKTATNYAGTFRYTAMGTGNYRTVYKYLSSNSFSYLRALNRNTTIFNICTELPPCVRPDNVILSNIQTTSVDAKWSGEATNFTVAYGPRGFNLDSVGTYQTLQTTDTNITITGLTPSTRYDVYVRSYCGDFGTNSEWSYVVSFTSVCTAFDIPYIETFDNYTEDVVTGTTAPTTYPEHIMPTCWNVFPLATSTSTYPQSFITSSTTYAQRGNAIFFKSKKGSALYAVLPTMNADLDTLKMEFTYRNESLTATNGILSVGVMSDVTDTNSFIELFTYPVINSFTRAECTFASTALTGNNYNIAFRYQGLANNMYFSIDSVVVDYITPCMRPTNLVAENITQTTADLVWNSYENTGFIIEYGPAGFELGQGTVIATTSNPHTITGLEVGSRYDYYVRSICSSGDTTEYPLTKGTFRTECGLITTLPWNADIDGTWESVLNNTTAVYPSCWDIIDTGYVASAGTRYNWRNTTSSSYIRTGSKAIYFAGLTTTTAIHNDWLITPELQLTGNERLVFWMRNSSTTATDGYAARVAIYAYSVNPADTTPNYVQVAPRIVMHGTGSSTYAEHIVPLTGLTGNVKLAFVVDTNSYSFYIDDVVVEEIPSCEKPRRVSVDSTTATSVTLSWRGVIADYVVEYKTETETAWSSVAGTNDTIATVTNLLPSTNYQFRVKAVCAVGDSSVWSDIITGATECGPISLPFVEDFSSTTFPANCWSRMSGLAFSGAALTSTTSYITRVTTNNGIQTPHAKINIYGTSVKVWLITPEIDLANESGAELSFDIALTKYATADTIETCTPDDKFMVIISRDGGNTWLREDATIWSDLETDSADYSYRGIRKTAERITIDLSQYYGDTIKIAFYGESTVTGGDNDLHIDNILVETSCPSPIITSTTYDATTATIAWTSSATDFQIAYKEATAADWGAEINVTNATTYTITGLMPTTNYQYRIRTICEEGAYSGWREGAFTTIELPCTAPTNIVATNITYTSATLGWEGQGNELAWEVKYTTGGVEETIEATTNPVVIENLFSGSTYEVWVRAFCGAETYSDWSEVYTFTTAACEVPSNVTASDITDSSATITWTSTAQRWEISYGMEGVNEENGTKVTVEGTPSYAIEGLDYETTYDVYVRAICEDGVYSAWTSRIQFTTDRIGINTADNDNVNVCIYPNPANTEATISVEGVNGNVEFVVADMNGRMVITETIACEGSLVKTIDVSNLAKGAYFVHIYNNNFNTTRKLIVK